ncbi:MAG: hypothetical protein H0T49_04765 [Chloroflexia bacterium]|nr:hypothetical protein [Chloroflexia bacterium]
MHRGRNRDSNLDGHSLPVDAVVQGPREAADLITMLEALCPASLESESLDDLTNFPCRRAIIKELERRLVSREHFAAGLLRLEGFGRSGLDPNIVLLSVLPRRNAVGSTPVSIGYLNNGNFLILRAPMTVHATVAQTVRGFEAPLPAVHEMNALFGSRGAHNGSPAGMRAQGSVCLVDPARFENVYQIGFALAESATQGIVALRGCGTAVARLRVTAGASVAPDARLYQPRYSPCPRVNAQRHFFTTTWIF